MIREDDLLEAIAECQGERNPNANTCIKLAAYYTILDNLKKDQQPIQIGKQNYSFSAEPQKPTQYQSETEFGILYPRLNQTEALRVIDELLETLRVIHPKLYEATMRKLTVLEK